MNLIWKFFRAGYMEVDKAYLESLICPLGPGRIGLAQGGILSPILSNLYLTPFDEYVDTLKEKYNPLRYQSRKEIRNFTFVSPLAQGAKAGIKYESIIGNPGKVRISSPATQGYPPVSQEKPEILDIKNTIAKAGGIKLRTPEASAIRTGRGEIHYVRYADDWLIGVSGPKSLAMEIRDQVKEFLSKELKLELNMDKTKITHLGSEYATFLGHYIKGQTLAQNPSLPT